MGCTMKSLQELLGGSTQEDNSHTYQINPLQLPTPLPHPASNVKSAKSQMLSTSTKTVLCGRCVITVVLAVITAITVLFPTLAATCLHVATSPVTTSMPDLMEAVTGTVMLIQYLEGTEPDMVKHHMMVIMMHTSSMTLKLEVWKFQSRDGVISWSRLIFPFLTHSVWLIACVVSELTHLLLLMYS